MFSKYDFLLPLKTKTAISVGSALDILFAYPPLHLDIPETVPKMLLSDSGKEFTNKLVRTVCLKRDNHQIFSKPYHPLGMIERFNQTIKRPQETTFRTRISSEKASVCYPVASNPHAVQYKRSLKYRISSNHNTLY